jgi:hypothetical protein
MEGGVGFFLLLVILVVAVIAGVALYLTGGAILTRGGKPERKPRGKTDPILENTERARPPRRDRDRT